MKLSLCAVAALVFCSMSLVKAADEVPPEVKKAFDTKYAGATDVKSKSEVENGKTQYEFKFKDKAGVQHEAEFAPDGSLIAENVEIKVGDVPKAVSDTVAKEYPGSKIEKAELETEGGKTVYELKIEAKGDVDYELEVAADGSKILEAKKIDEKKSGNEQKDEKK
jgi:uncharacterized membrane protein YkoI